MKRRNALKAISAAAVGASSLSGSSFSDNTSSGKGLSVAIKEFNGGPTLFINGEPSYYFAWWTTSLKADSWPRDEIIRKHADSTDIHIYAFEGAEAWCGPGEESPGHFHFSAMDRKFEKILNADPKALFHLRINLEMYGKWWHEINPLELEITSEGVQDVQSYASVVWREEAKEFLRAYADHMEKAGLTDRVLAYQVGAGHTGEWCKRAASMGSPCGDYSAPMRKHFRKWLAEKYRNDVTLLRYWWNNPDITFDSVEVPKPVEQIHARNYVFRDPKEEMNVIDYITCLSELSGDLVIDFCKTVKEATGGKPLAGAFYGYLMEMAWNSAFFAEWPERWWEGEYSTLQRSGHLGLAKTLESPYVDFFVSPYSYGFRGVGGDGPCMLPAESLRIRNKFFIYEEDSRLSDGGYHTRYGRADNTDQSLAMLTRNFSYIATHSQGEWIIPKNDSTINEFCGKLKKIGNFTIQTDRSPSADIAVIVDDESFIYESSKNNLDLPLIFHQKLQGLPRIGAPYDNYLLNDFLGGKIKPYKLYIFLNAFRLDGKRRALLKKELRRDGRTALWIYAPGYINDTPSVEHMTDITGFGFGANKYPWSEYMYVTDFNHPITEGLPQDLFWGTTTLLSPHFHIEDKDALILGKVIYSQGSCVPGFGVKKFPEWTSIYCSAPNLPAPVLRGIAKFAKVHIYNESGDVLHVSRDLLGVHTISGGKRTFRLPEKVQEVYDLVANKTVAKNTGQFEVTLKTLSSYLFYTGKSALLRENER